MGVFYKIVEEGRVWARNSHASHCESLAGNFLNILDLREVSQHTDLMIQVLLFSHSQNISG